MSTTTKPNPEHMTIDEAKAILAPHAWTHPSSYAGFEPTGDYVILAQHRDADSVTRSNWEVARTVFDVQPFDYQHDFLLETDNYGVRPDVYDWRASHCLVGWVEYLMVRADAPDDTLIRAAQIINSVEDYPILDEGAHDELEMREAEEAWSNLNLRGRLEVITYRDGTLAASLFSIRHDFPPSDDQGYIMEQLRS